MSHPVSPYHIPGFYADALAKGRHRDIVGGRWDETGRIQMQLLRDEGLLAHHQLLDIGAGSLRLGCKAVPYLAPGHYWATDLSGPLMRHGYAEELIHKDRLPISQIIEDSNFDFPGVPASIDFALAFAVFTHLPAPYLRHGLTRVQRCFPHLIRFLFTVFVAPDPEASLGPLRQPDGVVTHPNRAPYHLLAEDVRNLCNDAGFEVEILTTRLPRGQVLCRATPV